MVVPSGVRAANAKVDRWFRDHVVVWWLVLAIVPGGAYAVSEVLIDDGSAFQAAILGVVFGATFATVTVALQRWRGGST